MKSFKEFNEITENYSLALKALKDLMKRKTDGKHSVSYYAGQIAKSHSGVDARKLASMYEEAPLNKASGSGVDLNPAGRKPILIKKMDRRSRWHTENLYKKNCGRK